MMNLTERAAYIQGLCEGLELPDSKEGRIIKELLGLVTEMATYVTDLDESVSELGEEMDDLTQELGDIADELEEDYEDEDEEDEDEDLYEITCPECGEKLFLDYDELMQSPSVACPACGADIPIDVPECTGNCEGCSGCGPVDGE